MNDEVIKYYELLGVLPGASLQELKAAHRDLAKVWHPDRFSHDPRLQQKAQEKLKEINEAFDQLKAGKTGRRTQASAQTSSQTNQSSTTPQAPARRNGTAWKFILLPALAFALIFLAAFRFLIPTGQERTTSRTAQTEQAQTLPKEEGQQTDSSMKLPASEAGRGKRFEQEASKEAQAGDATVIEREAKEMRPLPTVTVMIDPSSGMLATPDCPLKSRMTYPGGAEPRAYCNLSHRSAAPGETTPARPKESRLKTFAKRLSSPGKLFGGKGNSDEGSSSSSKQDDKSNRR